MARWHGGNSRWTSAAIEKKAIPQLMEMKSLIRVIHTFGKALHCPSAEPMA